MITENYSHDNDGGTLLVCAYGSAETGGVYMEFSVITSAKMINIRHLPFVW